MPVERMHVYKCGMCGSIVEVLHAGSEHLACCNKPMELLKEKTQGEGMEKHVPVIEKTGTGVKVKVGSAEHPMEEEHYIEWIELIADGNIHIKFLKPGDRPEAEFNVTAEKLGARENCTVHGLWKS